MWPRPRMSAGGWRREHLVWRLKMFLEGRCTWGGCLSWIPPLNVSEIWGQCVRIDREADQEGNGGEVWGKAFALKPAYIVRATCILSHFPCCVFGKSRSGTQQCPVSWQNLACRTMIRKNSLETISACYNASTPKPDLPAFGQNTFAQLHTEQVTQISLPATSIDCLIHSWMEWIKWKYSRGEVFHG